MEILTVKENGQGGFLVNGDMSVPNSSGNRHYRMVQEWIADGGVVDPFETVAEITARETAEANAVALKELEELDLQSIRAIREYIAAQPGAPKVLKDKEAAANVARKKLK